MPRHPIEPQLAELRAQGCERVLTLSPEWSSWVKAMDHVRKGDTVVVRYLHLLAPPRLSTADSRRRFLFRCVRDLLNRNALVIEASSGRTSKDIIELLAAIEDAVEYITFHAHSRSRRTAQKNGMKGGRPRTEFSIEEKRRAFVVYTDLELSGSRLRAELRKIGWSHARCHREWGGRNTATWKEVAP